MSIFDTDGWRQAKCDFCGIHTPSEGIVVMICYATENNESSYPFSQMCLCKKHLEEIGMDKVVGVAKSMAERGEVDND